jgi:hypothetical protein
MLRAAGSQVALALRFVAAGEQAGEQSLFSIVVVGPAVGVLWHWLARACSKDRPIENTCTSSPIASSTAPAKHLGGLLR